MLTAVANIISTEEPYGMPHQDAQEPLRLFWVGDSDVYAARSEGEAYSLHLALYGEDVQKDFALEDVTPVDEISLDSTNRYEDGKPAPTLRETLAGMTQPGPVSLG